MKKMTKVMSIVFVVIMLFSVTSVFAANGDIYNPETGAKLYSAKQVAVTKSIKNMLRFNQGTHAYEINGKAYILSDVFEKYAETKNISETYEKVEQEKTPVIEDVEAPVEGELEVVGVSAINVNQVQVTFNKAVEDTSAATFAVKKGVANYFSAVEWNEANTVATVTTTIKLPAGDYAVEVTGLTDEALTDTVAFEAEKVESIVVNETTVERTSNAPFTYEVRNQYGADMKVTSGVTALAYNVTQAKSHTLTATAGKSEYKFDANFDVKDNAQEAKADDVIRITLTYSGVTVQHNLTVIDAKAAAEVTLGTVDPKEGKSLIFQGDTGLVLPVTVHDQYGDAVKLAATLVNADGIVGEETISGVTFTSSDATIVDIDKITVDSDGVVKFPVENKAGTATITAIVNSTGSVSTTTVKAEKTATVEEFTMLEPTAVVAGGDVLTVEYSAVDQYGTALDSKLATTTADADGNAGVESITFGSDTLAFTSSDATILDVDKITVDAKGALKLTTEAKAGNVTLTVKNGTDTVGTLALDVQAPAEATKISAVSTTKTIDTNLVENKVVEVKVENFAILDQYGREYTLQGNEGMVAWMSDGTETYVDLGDQADSYAKDGSDSADANAILMTRDNTTGFLKVKGKAATGSEKVKFQLTSDTTGPAANLVADSTFELEFTNVASPTSYTIATDATEYVAGDDITVTITAKDSSSNTFTAYNQSGFAAVRLDTTTKTYNKPVTFVNGVATVTVPATFANDDIDVSVVWDSTTIEIGANNDGDIKVVAAELSTYKPESGTTKAKEITITAKDAYDNTITSVSGTKLINVIVRDKDGNKKAIDAVDASDNILATFANGVVTDLEIDAVGDKIVATDVVTITVDGITSTFTVE